jgi:16S rRNA G966 N2-methylase RsmD
MKKTELSKAAMSRLFRPVEHLNRQIPPEAHTAMYVWHKYWSRKTWNVVGEFIKNYTREQEVVLDPFAGSGVVAIEAVRNKRRAIVCDLNPIAGLITELTLRPVDPLALRRAFEGVQARVQKRIEALYEVHCVKCGKPVVAACFVREGDAVTEVRYPGCPSCEYRAEKGDKLRKEDTRVLETLECKRIKEWHPRHRLYYPDGEPFKEKQRFDSLDQLFTRRNLQAVAWLYEAIQQEKSPQLRKFLMGAFTSTVHLCTRMCPALAPGEGNHQTAFSSTWTQHSYWFAPRFLEANVWDKFESAVIGHQGIIRAKEESARELPKVRITNEWRKVLDGEADVAIITQDCIEMMGKMPDNCADYIFTDPPYDASIQYGELSFLWNAWLKEDHRYAERLVTHEIVRNERQRKNFEVYHSLLSNSLREFYRVLRPGRHLTLTFHNPTFKVRNATVRASVFAGFDYQKIHHQPLGQVSAKAMMQPFGSAQGDFYLRFEKPAAHQKHTLKEITDERFRRIVIETCREVMAERAEPTPYTLLINYVDPKLARLGFFGTLDTGLDVKKVLEESVGKEFKLLPARMGAAEGKLWWINDMLFVKKLTEVPLSERVEQAVFRILNQHGRVTFTTVWDGVSQQFPNSLTPDSTSIEEALEKYGRKTGKGFWMLREEVRARVATHAEIIALMAMIGRKRGHEIWIGRNEQGLEAGGVASAKALRLSTLVTTRPTKLDGVVNLPTVLDMDLLWLDGTRVVAAIEVEATTTMTSGLLRGSNLPAATPKIMVLPEEREKDFQRKMDSPLFREHFETENWRLVYFDALREAFLKTRERTDVEALAGLKAPPKTAREVRESNQMLLTL